MISFMILGAPRSGTTWAANWLTTERTMCIHDPLYRWHYLDLDCLPCDRVLGVSCTGLAMFPDYVNAHPARKVILHRQADEVRASLRTIGLPPLPYPKLDLIRGLHVHWTSLFNAGAAAQLWGYLIGPGFDRARFDNLVAMNVQPNHGAVSVDKAATARLMAEVAAAAPSG